MKKYIYCILSIIVSASIVLLPIIITWTPGRFSNGLYGSDGLGYSIGLLLSQNISLLLGSFVLVGVILGWLAYFLYRPNWRGLVVVWVTGVAITFLFLTALMLVEKKIIERDANIYEWADTVKVEQLTFSDGSLVFPYPMTFSDDSENYIKAQNDSLFLRLPAEDGELIFAIYHFELPIGQNLDEFMEELIGRALIRKAHDSLGGYELISYEGSSEDNVKAILATMPDQLSQSEEEMLQLLIAEDPVIVFSQDPSQPDVFIFASTDEINFPSAEDMSNTGDINQN